ncbi:exocyst complex component EXO70H1-like [Olea europaea subsp. europaea]|uniref:Exocyst subunit Exo70 family protein n=2 Tax=Olea europaea subsp. europaea TaxID=158383 RepID=A0A8S0P843_OLEEU|nr:exocyst complex component EXO70H1-like [Olea europaea subsp. europaea]
MTKSRPSSPLQSQHSISPPFTPPRNFSETIMEENIDYAEMIVTKWDLDGPTYRKMSTLFGDDRKEAERFIEGVTGLRNAMHFYVKINSSSEKLIRAQRLMQVAMKRLEKEFYSILSSNRNVLDAESVSARNSRGSTRSSLSDFLEDEIEGDEIIEDGNSVSEADKASSLAIADLRSIADCMIGSGYGKECVRIYDLIRKSMIDESLYNLGVEKMNPSQIQKLDWNVLEAKIKSWLHAVKSAVKNLFYGERILCDSVFSSSEKIAESCFAEISRDAAINLFGFPENFAKSKKILSPEKMFRALDLYEAISDLWPEIEIIFSYDSLSAVKAQAVASLVKLGESIRVMLTQFELAIQKDSSKTPSTGGVHPLTRYVMNYLVFLGDYSGAVSDILADWPLNAQTPLPESYFSSPISNGAVEDTSSSVTVRLAWLILVLLCKLDGKATLYNDVALSYLFLANNLNYVVSKVRNSSLRLLMGYEWISKHQSKVKQYAGNYERTGWIKVLTSLPENPTAEFSPQEVKEIFSLFNSGFEETYRKQSGWLIPDRKLGEEIKISLAKKIVPGYRVLYEKHRGMFRREIGVESIVRYAPEDLNNYLSDLFFGTEVSESTKTWSYGTLSESSPSSHGR